MALPETYRPIQKSAPKKKSVPNIGTASFWSAPAKTTQKAISKGYFSVAPTAPRTTYTYSAPRTPSRSSNSGGGGSGGGRAYSSYNPYAAQARAAKAAAAKAAREKAAREKKENAATKKQVKALKQMIDKSFAKNRNTKLAALTQSLKQQDAAVMQSYKLKTKGIDRLYDDNEKTEHDATHANLQNKVRERGEILAEALSQGAGETDVLRAQMMAARNWAANQRDVNRSYFDTASSVSNALTELNADTKVERVNLQNKSNKDKSSVWDTYYGQITDTWTQIANLEGQNTNKSYKKLYPSAMKKAATAAGKAWKDPGVSKEVRNWKGQQARDSSLNNTEAWTLQTAAVPEMKRPEGATLRKW